MVTATILFALAAVGGAVMAALRLGGRELPPTGLAMLHGILAAAGLITLIVTIVGNVVPTLAVASLIGFIIAALGGFTLFFLFHLKKRALPIPIMLVHATVAVISFILLLVVLFK
ncbi:hypothetical protein [Geotalea sp. SG265]|uniref:hypothetical protein n=1 Tax=Geotalea sp. SG265 TaxID=2922867 RepID=UPI001FAEBE2C|nr:hypothetical protein [Geotalea sp. SG265]